MPRMGIEPMQAAAGAEAAVTMDFAENVAMIDCELLHTGSYGIWLRQECHGTAPSIAIWPISVPEA